MCRGNLFNGLDWIGLKNKHTRAKFVDTTDHQNQGNFIVPVLFIDNGESILMGGNDGNASVWSLATRQVTQTLQHDRKCNHLTIAVSACL